MRKLALVSVLLVTMVWCAIPLTAAKKKNKAAASAQFDFYLLSLSWAPDFCAQGGGNRAPRECGPGRKLGFIVHGLWPQAEAGRGPENCGGSPVAESIVQTMLSYMYAPGLVQHEWTSHGTCSGLSAAEYFAAMRKARDSVKVPADFQAPDKIRQLSPGAIDRAFADANPAFPKNAFRTTCTSGMLQETRICFNKDVTPRACPASVNECSAPSIKVLPVK